VRGRDSSHAGEGEGAAGVVWKDGQNKQQGGNKLGAELGAEEGVCVEGKQQQQGTYTAAGAPELSKQGARTAGAAKTAAAAAEKSVAGGGGGGGKQEGM